MELLVRRRGICDANALLPSIRVQEVAIPAPFVWKAVSY